LASILTPDPSAPSVQGLVLHGRTLDVVHAVTREEAGKLKEAAEKAREKADKRNMYLLREGGEPTRIYLLLPLELYFSHSDPIKLPGRRNAHAHGGSETRRLVQCPTGAVGIKSIFIRVQDTPQHSTDSNVRDGTHAETLRHPRDPSL
jgi:hypothetical protein